MNITIQCNINIKKHPHPSLSEVSTLSFNNRENNKFAIKSAKNILESSILSGLVYSKPIFTFRKNINLLLNIEVQAEMIANIIIPNHEKEPYSSLFR